MELQWLLAFVAVLTFCSAELHWDNGQWTPITGQCPTCRKGRLIGVENNFEVPAAPKKRQASRASVVPGRLFAYRNANEYIDQAQEPSRVQLVYVPEGSIEDLRSANLARITPSIDNQRPPREASAQRGDQSFRSFSSNPGGSQGHQTLGHFEPRRPAALLAQVGNEQLARQQIQLLEAALSSQHEVPANGELPRVFIAPTHIPPPPGYVKIPLIPNQSRLNSESSFSGTFLTSDVRSSPPPGFIQLHLPQSVAHLSSNIPFVIPENQPHQIAQPIIDESPRHNHFVARPPPPPPPPQPFVPLPTQQRFAPPQQTIPPPEPMRKIFPQQPPPPPPPAQNQQRFPPRPSSNQQRFPPSIKQQTFPPPPAQNQQRFPPKPSSNQQRFPPSIKQQTFPPPPPPSSPLLINQQQFPSSNTHRFGGSPNKPVRRPRPEAEPIQQEFIEPKLHNDNLSSRQPVLISESEVPTSFRDLERVEQSFDSQPDNSFRSHRNQVDHNKLNQPKPIIGQTRKDNFEAPREISVTEAPAQISPLDSFDDSTSLGASTSFHNQNKFRNIEASKPLIEETRKSPDFSDLAFRPTSSPIEEPSFTSIPFAFIDSEPDSTTFAPPREPETIPTTTSSPPSTSARSSDFLNQSSVQVGESVVPSSRVRTRPRPRQRSRFQTTSDLSNKRKGSFTRHRQRPSPVQITKPTERVPVPTVKPTTSTPIRERTVAQTKPQNVEASPVTESSFTETPPQTTTKPRVLAVSTPRGRPAGRVPPRPRNRAPTRHRFPSNNVSRDPIEKPSNSNVSNTNKRKRVRVKGRRKRPNRREKTTTTKSVTTTSTARPIPIAQASTTQAPISASSSSLLPPFSIASKFNARTEEETEGVTRRKPPPGRRQFGTRTRGSTTQVRRRRPKQNNSANGKVIAPKSEHDNTISSGSGKALSTSPNGQRRRVRVRANRPSPGRLQEKRRTRGRTAPTAQLPVDEATDIQLNAAASSRIEVSQPSRHSFIDPVEGALALLSQAPEQPQRRTRVKGGPTSQAGH